MSIDLDTGTIQIPATNTPPALGNNAFRQEEFTDTTPAEAVIFPSENRKLLVVEPNTLMIITGYNLDPQTKVIFRKVLRSNGVPASGSAGCCPTITIGHATRLHSVELPCWRLDHCNPVFIIKTPACYELDVDGLSADVVVTAMAFPMQPTNEFTKCECMEPKP